MIAGIVSAFALAAAAPAGATILPVGVWHFNEGSGTVAHSDSNHSNDGSLQGGAGWTQGRFRSALSFDGNSAAVLVPDSPSLEGANVTVSAWVLASSSPGNFKYIVDKGANNCLTASYGLYTGASGGLEFYIGTSSVSYAISPDAGSGIWDGNWHNVIGTYDGSTVRLYVDGQQVGSGSADTTPIAYGLPTSNDLMIGDYSGCSGLDFSGSIDEVKVFDRALGANEIRLANQVSRWLPSGFPFDLIL